MANSHSLKGLSHVTQVALMFMSSLTIEHLEEVVGTTLLSGLHTEIYLERSPSGFPAWSRCLAYKALSNYSDHISHSVYVFGPCWVMTL